MTLTLLDGLTYFLLALSLGLNTFLYLRSRKPKESASRTEDADYLLQMLLKERAVAVIDDICRAGALQISH